MAYQAPKTSLSCREGRYIRIYQSILIGCDGMGMAFFSDFALQKTVLASCGLSASQIIRQDITLVSLSVLVVCFGKIFPDSLDLVVVLSLPSLVSVYKWTQVC
jgi:hypothetical protein